MEVYVARQPIFNRKKKIYGYELLFRGGMSNYFPDIDGDIATSKLLANSFFSIGIEKITGKKKAFINFTQDLLINLVPLMFSNEKVVVEILEDVEPEENVVDACREISKKGYIIALDDFIYHEKLRPLISTANLIKFDLRASSFEEMAKNIKLLSNYNLKLLAEKVETYEEFQKAVDMGFDLFQGYFFSKPEIIEGKEISGSKLNLLGIMAEVNKNNFNFDNLEKIISRDVAISYKLLRYINSAYYRRLRDISSIKQAIVMIGEKGIRQFVSIVAVSDLSSDKPDELIKASIIRAKFCELVGNAHNNGRTDPAELFTLGLFSLIDAIMDDDMENLMDRLPLSINIKDALIDHKGFIYDHLQLIIGYELGEWESVLEIAHQLKIDEKELPLYYSDALEWADNFSEI